MTEMTLDTMDKRILDIIQTDFPLESLALRHHCGASRHHGAGSA